MYFSCYLCGYLPVPYLLNGSYKSTSSAGREETLNVLSLGLEV
ncbi:hypothetical protein CWRG_01672 [Chthonomonas calidirosea]|nr:hypothetical protein CWRG_01672 [Chthonomonas calidirosea]CEK16953.1 hypothetical protein CP488_01687 [Chthonomonas calidirosea]